MLFTTTLTHDQLKRNAKALGLCTDQPGALVCAAMVSDEMFREKVARFFFDRALLAVGKDDLQPLEPPPALPEDTPALLKRQAY